MTHDEAFLRDIVESPEDDAPRLIYADWLEDNGQPERAEFIRVQLALAGMPADDPSRDELRATERGLLEHHAHQWAGPPKELAGWRRFRRGFIEPVTAPAAEVLAALRRGEPICDTTVEGLLDLHLLCEGDDLRLPVRLGGCRLQGLDGVCIQFHRPVLLGYCTVEGVEGRSFYAAYFLGGLHVTGCSFESSVDFQCGGHNQAGHAFVLEGTSFRGFVDFFDCWFTGPVMIRGCTFERGTNLLGNLHTPGRVQFDVPPCIEGNKGRLDCDGG
jgi:uncharacterized protein (TIGR02996 family)